MEHQLGQYRAQLFDELIARLLGAMYPKAEMIPKDLLRVPHNGTFRSLSIDFRLSMVPGDIAIETKAPYSESSVDELNQSLRRLSTMIDLLSPGRIKTFILAVPIPFPHACSVTLEEVQRKASQAGAVVTVWDSTELLKLVRKHLSVEMESFSVSELERALPVESSDVSRLSLDRLKPGVFENVVVLLADFCSFSRFVVASDSDNALISSIMARFYRETGQTIIETGGLIDKYMGDGILVYWFGNDAGVQLERCVQRLGGIAVSLAEEWQDCIDYSVEPQGLRAGAAIGPVLFVSEQPMSSTIHAIGGAINLAARLQSAARPNNLVLSNRLRKRFFGNRSDFDEIGPDLKNIGIVRAWSKALGTPGAG
jgi:class 3 adenylate cyclase